MVELSARGTGLRSVAVDKVLRHGHHPSLDPSEVTVLDLSDNEVTTVSHLGETFPLVMELSLARNALFGLDARHLPSELSRLSLAHNKLESVSFLSALPALVDLDLSYNLLRSLDGVGRDGGPPPRLRRLSVRGNRVRRVDGVARLVALEVLDLGDNDLRTEEDLRPLSLVDAKLRYLVLEGNPLHPAGGQGGGRPAVGTASVKFHVMNLMPSLYMLDGKQLGTAVAAAGTRAGGSYASRSAAKARLRSESPSPSPRAPASAPRPQSAQGFARGGQGGAVDYAQAAPPQPRRPGGYPVAEIGHTALRRRPRPLARQPVLTRGPAGKPMGNGLWSSPPGSGARPRSAAPHTQPPLRAEASYGESPRRHLPFDTPVGASTAPPPHRDDNVRRVPRSAARVPRSARGDPPLYESDPFAHAYEGGVGSPEADRYGIAHHHQGGQQHYPATHGDRRNYYPSHESVPGSGRGHPSHRAEEAGFSGREHGGRGGYGGGGRGGGFDGGHDEGASNGYSHGFGTRGGGGGGGDGYESLLDEADNVAVALLEEKRRLLEEHVRQDYKNYSAERAQRASPADSRSAPAAGAARLSRGGSPEGITELSRRYDARVEDALHRAGVPANRNPRWIPGEDGSGDNKRPARRVGENLADAFSLILSQNWSGGTAPPSVHGERGGAGRRSPPRAAAPAATHARPMSQKPAPGFIRDEFRRNLARARRGIVD